MTWKTHSLADGPEPLWWQIAERLRSAIESGHFSPGDYLPSEAELNRLFGVSRTTARSALDKLRNEGLITRRSGKGSLVRAPYVEQPVTRMSSFSEDMAARGLVASYDTHLVQLETAPDGIGRLFNAASAAPLLHIRRGLFADGKAMAVSDSWLAADVLGGASLPTRAQLDNRSLYEWLENDCRQQIVAGTETIEAAIAGRPLAKELDVKPGAPVLIARRDSRGASGRLIERATIAYRADRYRFTLEMRRGS